MAKVITITTILLNLFINKTYSQTTDFFKQPYPDSIPAVFAPGAISVAGRLEHGFSLTPDMQEMAFGVLDKKDFSGRIWYTHNTGGQWTKPELFRPLKNKCVFLPYFSPDGTSLLYAKSKTLKDNYITDIWRLEKQSGKWGNSQKLTGAVNTSAREASACMTLTGTIYFSSNRKETSLSDLFYTVPNATEYSEVVRINTLSSIKDEESIFVAPDETYIIFSRFETTDKGPDLYISYRTIENQWTSPVALDVNINTSEWERRPFVTSDQRFLFFTRLSIKGSEITESDIYWVNTQKVFKPYVFHPIPVKTIQKSKETILEMLPDFFKDIDDSKLEISLDTTNPKWVTFNSEKQILSLHPNQTGEFKVTLVATDKAFNKTTASIKIMVIN
ncbi:hypothetical protein NBT05_13290 [Aquimarina sp. ERC-38]|uniref:putative Ig domain-containing protein n=1 Tax=Aquimarina sp. ERC-38 TaxID=2949996 RepID=UPI0022484A8B|nr:putative Ig domain-containing protein [Aquimarina sp. ERC-38]UZO79919.1 hypothetical protein NBT05_13290 [Aquimarina sp. ERC-38]